MLPQDKVTLVTATTQTAGRGRFKRTWVSPPDNIFATFCFAVEKHRTDVGNLPQVMALSVAQILEAHNFKPKIKWPNDLLLNDKKVSGILCETTPLSDHLAVALGVGVNVNMDQEALNQIDRPATSLRVEGGKIVTEELLLQLQTQFVANLDTFLEEGFHPFYPLYLQRIAHKKGEPLRFNDNRLTWEGTFHEITPDGLLHLALPGEIKTFIAGEIV